MRDRSHFILIPLAASLAVLPLLLYGPSCGHDFEFHLRSWLEIITQWKQGVAYPQWDFTAAWNAGEPRFVFYPPISWAIGAVLGLVIPWGIVPVAYIWLVLVACGFSMYRLACEWTSSGNALLAAAFYMVHPYMLFVFYERAAYSEFLAAVWVPLLFLSILRLRLSILSIAIPVALFWLTNAPAAIMACYSLAVLAAMRLAFTYRSERRISPVLIDAAKITAGTLLGITLAAFYLLPATMQQHWVHIDVSRRGIRYQDNFIFTHLGDISHDAILHTASLCALSLLILSGIFTLTALYPWAQRRSPAPALNTPRRRTVLILFLLACILGFLLSPLSAGLSRHIPELSFLRFPMRWSTILGATSAALFALALDRTNRIPFVAAAVLALAVPLILTFGGNSLFRQYCQNDKDVASLAADFRNGANKDSFDEYIPVGADGDALQHANPEHWLADSPTDAPPAATDAGHSNLLANRLHFDVTAPIPKFLVLSLRDYPTWRVSINGVPVILRDHRKDGLIALPVSPGISRVDITYAHTRDETAGWFISGVSALTLLFMMRKPAPTQSMLRRSTGLPDLGQDAL